MSKVNRVFVLNGPSYAEALPLATRADYTAEAFFRRPEDFDLVLFTGGEDVSPRVYGDTSPKGVCYSNFERDKQELEVFVHALKYGIKMAGICRGLQLLNCLAGGKMIHHLENHAGTIHPMTTSTGEDMVVNSLHHQAILPPKEAIIVGATSYQLSKNEGYIGAEDEYFSYDGLEVEAAIFPNHLSFGVQYHPEMMYASHRGHMFFSNMIEAALYLPWEEFLGMYRGEIKPGWSQKAVQNEPEQAAREGASGNA